MARHAPIRRRWTTRYHFNFGFGDAGSIAFPRRLRCRGVLLGVPAASTLRGLDGVPKLPSKKSAPVAIGLVECVRAAVECARQAYLFQPSSYTHATLIALHNASRFLPPIRNGEE
jgi:hypothetical protein